jgi:hypothetical protein
MHNPHKYDREESGRSIIYAAILTIVVTVGSMSIAIGLGDRGIGDYLKEKYTQVMENVR